MMTSRVVSSRSISLWIRAFLLVVFASVTFACTAAHAQLAGKGEIKGTVKDPSGAVIPGATVTATEVATGLSVTRTTNASGIYDISPVDAGVYTVTVSAPGFEKLSQTNLQVNALEMRDYSPVLTVGSSTETVTVTSAPPQLETSNATLGATMEQSVYSALPIEMGAYGSPDQRRATDFAFLMPGVQGNNTNGNPTTNTGVVNGSGSRGAVTAVYIDGLPFVRAGGNGDPRYVWTAISVDAVDQFQVQTNGYSAIYEGQGIQNYTVKSGGKDYHGSVYEFFRNTALDTWGFFGKLPNPATGKAVKPVEHSNEYGINLSGPLIPVGSLRDKLFFYGNYSGFRYSSATPTQITFPTAAQQAGNFQGVLVAPTASNYTSNLQNPTGIGVYDPYTQAACTANSTNGPCRYRYGYVYGGAPGAGGNPTLGSAGLNGVDVIPASEFSNVALKMQSFLPTGIGTGVQNNYIAPNPTGLTNWSTTERIDYVMSSKDSITLLAAIGRQASSVPVGQTTSGRNVGPVPYNFGQAYAPKTAVGVIEETHVFSPNIVNQLKYGYARYNGPTIDADMLPPFAATTMGITNLPSGAAQQAFPFATFSGTNAPTNWAGAGPNVTLAENYTLLDNLQWVIGNHTLTIGGQTAWMLYNVVNSVGGSTPLTLANTVTETAQITPSSNASPKYAATSGTGLSYASFLVGQIDKASFTQYLQQEFGARFRAISPYIQDNWKVTPKLTLDVGLRYDFFPTVTEVHNAGSFFNPNLANPVTGLNGALEFTGKGTNTCNCSTPVNNYMKNFGPRLGLAYQLDPKTVLRASWGVMFTHGGAVGGSATSLGTLGFSGGLSASASGTMLSTAPLTGANGALPSFAPPVGAASGPQYGTGYTKTSGYTGSPQTMGYPDPYLGGRAPEYINWAFGFQHQWTDALTSSISYVGSEGHFLPTDGGNPRGYWSNQLDPKYLSLGSNLALTGSALASYCAANASVCPSSLNIFSSSQTLATLLKPFPFQNMTDSFGYVGNSNYHALQSTLNWRSQHGLTFMVNYTWSRAIDDGGTFRTGYAIPAGTIANAPNLSSPADRFERTVSTSNQPQHLVVTGVWDLPIGKSVLGNSAVERALLGGFKFSEIFQAYSGSPLAITGSTCTTNPAQSTCEPALNPAFSGNARINGKWGQGYLAGMSTSTAPKYIDTTAFAVAPAYTFGNSPRTAPYGIYGPGNYNLDLALIRSFPLHFSEAARLNFRAEWYNVTNHTKFNVASAAYGNASFGQVTTDPTAARKSAQLSARIEF